MPSVTLTLTSEGTLPGNYSIYHTSVDPANLIEEGVTSAVLLSGYCTEEVYSRYWVKSNTPNCTRQESIDVPVPTPTPVPVVTPVPVTPTPVSPPTITDGWAFTAEDRTYISVDYTGLHIGTELSGSGFFHGTAASPTTTTVSIGDYQTQFFNITGGEAIVGQGSTASAYALSAFDINDSDSPTMALTLADASNNPGNISLSGTINGSDGSSGTWSATFVATVGGIKDGVPYNPESIADDDVSGGSFSINGLTLTAGVTYYVNIT